MILRALTVAGGLTGAAGLSQFPEFSQQYTQRLAGAVDELSRVVADFDSSAAAEGLSRDAALAQMSGTAFVERRRADMTRTIARHDRLQEDLATLRNAGPFTRFREVTRISDTEIARRAWTDYKPALPITFEGIVFAAFGFLSGLMLLTAVFRLFRWPFRNRKRA